MEAGRSKHWPVQTLPKAAVRERTKTGNPGLRSLRLLQQKKNASQRGRWFSERHRPSEHSVSGNKADSEGFCLGIWSTSISVRVIPQGSVVVRRTAGLSARGAIVYTQTLILTSEIRSNKNSALL